MIDSHTSNSDTIGTAGILAAVVRSEKRLVPPLPDEPAELPRMALAVRDVLVPALLGTASAALAAAGIEADEARELGCVTASNQATAATAEYIAAVLDGPGPRWLIPECFLYYSPHSLTGRLCIDLGINGTTVTLTGASSGVDALGYAAGMVTAGRCDRALVAAAHWPGPGRPDDGAPTVLRTAAAVLGTGSGTGRIGGWGPGGRHAALSTRPPQDEDPCAPFAELARWCSGRADRDLALAGGGSRLRVVPGGTQ